MSQFPRQFTTDYEPDNLIAGLTQLVSESGTLAAGQFYKRGSVMGRIAASGKFTLSLAAANDGSQVPYGVLYDDYDATASDVIGGIFVKGEFNGHALTLGAGHTVLTIHDPFRASGIYVKGAVLQSGAYT